MQLVSAPDFAKLSKHLQREKAKLFVRLAQEVIDDNTSRIARGVTYDGGAQKANKPSTIKRKGHAIALRDSGVLENPANYRIVKGGGVHVRVELPASRRQIVRWLEAKGYKYWGISTHVRQFAQKQLGLMWENAKRRL